MASSEMLGHLEGREQQKSALDNLPVGGIGKRPESVTTALQQSQKANEVAERIVGTERAGQIQKDNPQNKHPEILSKDPEIAQIQQTLYSSLGIDKNTDVNNTIKKFGKGVIDGLLVGNGEVIMMIKNEGLEKFISILKEQLGSLEGWKKIAEALGTSVWELFAGDSYERGKSLAELGLITTGAGAAGSLAKYAGKAAIRTSVKVGGETTARTAVSQTLYAAGRTAEVVGTGLQVPAKVVKKVAIETGKAVGVVSEKTGVSATLRAGARVGSEAYERSGAKKVVEGTRQIIKSSLDTGIATLGATEAVQAVKGRVSEVLETQPITKEEGIKVGEKYTPEIVAKLGDTDRLSVASELLGRTLTQQEKTAILKAHNLGEGGTGNYSASDIYSKADILKRAGFGVEERRVLMEKGVCGSEKVSPLEISLYSHPKYGFLQRYKEILGENVSLKDIVGEGQNAVIVRYRKDPTYVVKVAKDKIGVDDLNLEFANHKIFYAKYLEGNMKNNVKIPEVKDLGVNGAFLIQKIEGETLYSRSVRDVLGRKGISLPDGFTDKEIDALVDGKYGHLQRDINFQAYKDLAAVLGLQNYDEIMGLQHYLNQDIDSPVLNTLRYIMENTEKGLIHNDLHSGNIMINGDTIYVIDYGKVKKTK